MLLSFYYGFLIIGVILIALVLIQERRKDKLVPNNFIRDKILEFLKIKPLARKIEILENDLQQKEKSIWEDIPINHDGVWKIKYERLEAILQEKNAKLEKIEQALNNEIKNRKEFENFRSLLEEEIKNGKEKRRQLQAELNSLKMENENLRSKAAELEPTPEPEKEPEQLTENQPSLS